MTTWRGAVEGRVRGHQATNETSTLQLIHMWSTRDPHFHHRFITCMSSHGHKLAVSRFQAEISKVRRSTTSLAHWILLVLLSMPFDQLCNWILNLHQLSVLSLHVRKCTLNPMLINEAKWKHDGSMTLSSYRLHHQFGCKAVFLRVTNCESDLNIVSSFSQYPTERATKLVCPYSCKQSHVDYHAMHLIQHWKSSRELNCKWLQYLPLTIHFLHWELYVPFIQSFRIKAPLDTGVAWWSFNNLNLTKGSV